MNFGIDVRLERDLSIFVTCNSPSFRSVNPSSSLHDTASWSRDSSPTMWRLVPESITQLHWSFELIAAYLSGFVETDHNLFVVSLVFCRIAATSSVCG